MTAISALRRLAVVQQVSEAETVFGGRSRLWTDVAALWIALAPPSGREVAEAGAPPALRTTATAEARDHPGLAPEQRLVLGADRWRVTQLARGEPRPGRMTLFLEKDDR